IDGWVKLHRKTLKSRVFRNAELLKLWVYCLCRANHEEQWVEVRTGKGVTEVLIKPGQFIYGRLQTARQLSTSPSSVRNRMVKLESMQNLVVEPDTHYSIVTICNWETYQAFFEEEGQAKGQPQDNHRTTTGQPQDTDKNDKNVKNDKKKESMPSPSFDKFWAEYPKSRRNDKKRCSRIWKDEKLELIAEKIITALKSHKKSEQWMSNIIPNATTWLNQERWEQELSRGKITPRAVYTNPPPSIKAVPEEEG
ncbi:hypothetical protein LCGC14_2336750, partial [marine sediment metagenome]